MSDITITEEVEITRTLEDIWDDHLDFEHQKQLLEWILEDYTQKGKENEEIMDILEVYGFVKEDEKE